MIFRGWVIVSKWLEFIKEYDYDTEVFSKPVIDQACALTKVLTEAFSKFVPTKKVNFKSNDQPWTNSYTRLLMRKKNRNYQIYKKINNNYIAAFTSNLAPELLTRLHAKKRKGFLKISGCCK